MAVLLGNGDGTFRKSSTLSGVKGSPDVITPADFNGDGDFGTDQYIEAFFACLAGQCCSTCGTADFNPGPASFNLTSFRSSRLQRITAKVGPR